MVFVIKATLKDETRRVTFASNKFPPFSEVQNRVSIHVSYALLVPLGLEHAATR